jgi:hypothetical protein
MPDAATWKKFHDLLYKNQPSEGSAGLSNKQLISYGKQAGAKDPALTQCINGSTYKSWVSKITDQASKNNVTGTPTVRIDGQDVQGASGAIPNATDLKNAIKAGHGNVGAGKKSGSSSDTWVIVLVIVVVVLVVAFFLVPRNRRRRT